MSVTVGGCKCDKEYDKCESPMFNSGASLVHNSNVKYDDYAVVFSVTALSSVAQLSDVRVTIKFPNEIVVGAVVAGAGDTINIVNNELVWATNRVVESNKKTISIPVTIKKGKLVSPIFIETKLNYKQLPGCEGYGLGSGAYLRKITITDKGSEFGDWKLIAN